MLGLGILVGRNLGCGNKRDNMTQDERHRAENHDMLNWLKANRKKLNAGELKEDRVKLFQKLLEIGEKNKRVNQYQ